MGGIYNGYHLVWDTSPTVAKEMRNSKLALKHPDFVTKATYIMVVDGADSVLTFGVIPTDTSPLDVVLKPHSDKFRLIVNMRYVNNHLIKRVIKFEGLSDIAKMAERGVSSSSHDLTSGYYHVVLHPDSRRFVGFTCKETILSINLLTRWVDHSPLYVCSLN